MNDKLWSMTPEDILILAQESGSSRFQKRAARLIEASKVAPEDFREFTNGAYRSFEQMRQAVLLIAEGYLK